MYTLLQRHFKGVKTLYEDFHQKISAEIYEALKYADAYTQQADRKIAKHIQGHN